MLDFLLENFRSVVFGSMVVTVVISRINRVVGSALGLIVILGLGILGTLIYESGGKVGLGTLPVSQPIFYVVCIALAVLNITALRVSLARQSRSHP